MQVKSTKRTPYLHQHIVPRLSSDPEPRVSGILHLYVSKDHLKVSIIPATQVSSRAFTGLQKDRGEVTNVSHQFLVCLRSPRVWAIEHFLTKESPKTKCFTAALPTRSVNGTWQKLNKVLLTICPFNKWLDQWVFDYRITFHRNEPPTGLMPRAYGWYIR